jgi:UDP-N-acetylmuramyl tripeptide synthase
MSLMRKPFKFYQAVVIARLAMLTLKLLGRRGSHYPGVLLLKVCPDFLNYVAKPKKLIAITGTNGKTTVTNLISDALKTQGVKLASNAYGSNIQEGIFVTLLKASNFFATRSLVDVVVLEVDERVSPKIYPHLIPDVLVITNLFRDSYRRNAHVEFIADILTASIPSSTHLIVNADDPISSFLTPNSRTSFAIAPQPNEVEDRASRINDLVLCPRCHHPLTYRLNRYHHIGQVTCTHCRFASMNGDVVIEDIHTDGNELTLVCAQERTVMKTLGSAMMDHYNLLACVTTLMQLGYTLSEVKQMLETLKIVDTRFDQSQLRGKTVTVMMTKDQNPIATSRVLDTIVRSHAERKALILVNENSDDGTTSENMAWYYDCDFERIVDPSVVQMIGGGYRVLDLKVRLLIAGFPAQRMQFTAQEVATAELVDVQNVDHIYILNGTKNIDVAQQIKTRLITRIQQEVSA